MKVAVVAAAVLALSGVVTGTANAGTEDFFRCPQWPPERVQLFTRVTDGQGTRNVFMEKCWSDYRHAFMFRGNVQFPQLGDELTIWYTGPGGRVKDSSRVAPRDVDPEGYMPGEWYLAGGGSQGTEIMACVTPSGEWANVGCTWK